MLSSKCNHKSRHFAALVNKYAIRRITTSDVTMQQVALKEEYSIGVRHRTEWDNAAPYSRIPGPKSLPIIGIAYKFFPGGQYHGFSLRDLNRSMVNEYGPLVNLPGLAGKPDIIFAFDPDDVEKVYRSEGIWPARRRLETFDHYRQDIRRDVYVDSGGLVSEQGKRWHEFRMKVNPVMMQPRVVKQYIAHVEQVSDDFIDRMLKLRDHNNEMPKDFFNEIKKWALESIGVIALDTRLGCLEDELKPDSEAQMLIKSVDEFFMLTYKLEMLPSLWKWYATADYKRLMKVSDIMTGITSKYVDKATENIKDFNHLSSDTEMSVLKKLLKIDRPVAIVMVMDMLVAGVDTTSSSAINLLYFLGKNQKEQDKLRKEIIAILPEKDSSLNLNSFDHTPYLKACIKESARILPIVTFNIRAAGNDMVLSGYRIPKGTDVGLCHNILQNSEKEYPRPFEFIPERWLKDQNDTEMSECPSSKTAHRFAYMPFGFGPRTCIGRRFAELEMEVFLAKLIRNYKIGWNYGELEHESSLVNTPKGPLKFQMLEI